MADQKKPEKQGSNAKREPYIVCKQIRRYREAKGLERKDIAEYLGINTNAVCNWENGRARPDLIQLPKLCELLGVSIDALFGLAEPQTVSDAPAEEAEPIKPTIKMTVRKRVPGDDLLLEKFHRLNNGHQAFVESMLDKLYDVEDMELYNSIIETTLQNDSLSAGYDFSDELDDGGEEFLVYKDKVNPLMDCIYPVNGDSMEPEFHSGDYVMVQRLKNGSDLEFGEIGAFAFHNETYIKEYSRAGLRSLNKKYKMMRFNDDDNVFIIGRVLGVLSADAIVDFDTAKRYERIREAVEEAEED